MNNIIENIEAGIASGKAKAAANSKLNDGLSDVLAILEREIKICENLVGDKIDHTYTYSFDEKATAHVYDCMRANLAAIKHEIETGR
jgi:hypothetical protein